MLYKAAELQDYFKDECVKSARSRATTPGEKPETPIEWIIVLLLGSAWPSRMVNYCSGLQAWMEARKNRQLKLLHILFLLYPFSGVSLP